MRALVLFKGTGSVDRELEAAGVEVTSLDILPKFGATFTEDILTWNYRQFEPGHFDFVWASPVCTEFSMALTTRPRDLAKGDLLVLKALEIIEYLQPKFWTLENPQTGYLKTREYMQALPYQDVCYCMYGYQYRKATRLWGNVPFEARPMCTKDHRCEAWLGRVHTAKISGGKGKMHPGWAQRGGGLSRVQLYSIPPLLCRDIVASVQTRT